MLHPCRHISFIDSQWIYSLLLLLSYSSELARHIDIIVRSHCFWFEAAVSFSVLTVSHTNSVVSPSKSTAAGTGGGGHGKHHAEHLPATFLTKSPSYTLTKIGVLHCLKTSSRHWGGGHGKHHTGQLPASTEGAGNTLHFQVGGRDKQ